MREKITQQTRELQQSNGGHIFYEYESIEAYVRNTVSYIIAGIEQGDHVVVIENDRVYPLIHRELGKELNSDDMKKVHRVNNFDFYCFKGDFNSETVISYFKKFVEPFIENSISIRTWAHVEWADKEQITYYVGEYEKEVDQTVIDFG
ncbi:MEDS domain-containing protein, partial [Fictibacillus aquaticus]